MLKILCINRERERERVNQARKSFNFLNNFRFIFIFLLILGSFFVFTQQVSAATVYVSNSTTNGYSMGDDLNTYAAAQNKSTPWLTITKAVSTAVSSGDTIIINDGIYIEASFVSPSRSNLIINSETDYGVIIRAGSGVTRVFHVNYSGLTLGKIVLDANNTQTYCLTTDSSNNINSLTINGTKFLNPKSQFAYFFHLSNLTMNGDWIAQSSQAGTGFTATADQSGTYEISAGTITQTGVPTGITYAFRIIPSVTGNAISVSNLIINRTTSVDGNLYGISVDGSSEISIHDNQFTYSGATSVAAINIANNATITTTSCSVYKNTGNLSGTSGYTIFIGNESTATPNKIQNVLVYENNITGSNHGYAFSYITGGKMYKNYSNNLSIGIMGKYTVNSEFYDNIIINPGAGGGLRSKGGNGDKFYNNKVVSAGDSFTLMYVTDSASNIEYKNNIIYSSQTNTRFVNAETGSTAIFSNNDYYNTQTLPSYAWIYNTSNYGTFISWLTAHDSNSINSNPLFINSPTNLALLYNSPAIDNATSTSLTSDYTGTNYIYGTPDIGAYEYQPPHTIGTNEIDIGAGARIYGDGKFRDLNTINSTTADLKITPSTGTFSTYTSSEVRPAWLDITDIIWSNTGNHQKQWIESSEVSGLTNTLHTIGDLESGKYYNVTVGGSTTNITGDNCISGTCLANDNKIIFTYNGTYSTYTFNVVEDTTAPTNIGLSSITVDSSSQLTILAQTAVDVNSGLHGTPYYFSETSGHTGGSSSVYQASTTFIDSGLSENTQYTYKVKAKDANSNESAYSTTLSKYTLSNTPTTLAATATTNSMALSVDSFSNDTSGGSGYYFSNTTKGTNSGWTQTNSWNETGLNCGTLYNYSVKYRNGDATETNSISLNKTTVGCGGSGGFTALNNVPTITSTTNSPTNLTSSTPVSVIYNFSNRTLKLKIRGTDVQTLQKFLNNHGYTLTNTGAGSPNNETTLFGTLTKKAVIRFQKSNNLVPDGIVGPLTRGKMKTLIN
ncbi:MAG: peptidoglycan-binding protein [Candidatus Paceibacterota bacterium]|jgi:chitodextrinase